MAHKAGRTTYTPNAESERQGRASTDRVSRELAASYEKEIAMLGFPDEEQKRHTMATTHSNRVGRTRQRLAQKLMELLNEPGKPNAWYVDPKSLNSNIPHYATKELDGVSWDGYITWTARPVMRLHVYSYDTMTDLLRKGVSIVGKYEKGTYVQELEVCHP